MTTRDSASPPAPPPDDARRSIRDLGPAAVLGVVAATLPAITGITLFVYMGSVSAWFDAQSLAQAVGIYIAAFVVFSGLALLPTIAQTVLGGWVFGFAVGYPAALLGFTGGALLGYAVAYGVAQKRVERVLVEKPTWAAVRDALVRSGFWRTLGIVALVRVPLNSPFALTNLVLSSARTPLLPYALGTFLGMAPRTALYAWVGMTIHFTLNRDITKDTIAQATPSWVFWAGGASFLVALLVIGRIASVALRRMTNGVTPGPQPTSPRADA